MNYRKPCPQLRCQRRISDAAFKRLENRWRFLEASGGSDIDFFIDYEFRSPMLALLVGGMFDQAFRKFAEAFENRARKVYGAAPLASPLA